VSIQGTPVTGILAVGIPSSFEPRPKPDTTCPFMRNGYGASGPESGPIIVGRGVEVDI